MAIETDTGRREPLVEALFDVLRSTGRAALPPGRRAEVIDLLTRIVADPDQLVAHTAELNDRRTRSGPDVELRLLSAPRTDIPWERIRVAGFGDLPDDVLADLATSPEALASLEETQFRGQGEIGMWFFEAVFRENAQRPDAAARAEHSKQLARQALGRLVGSEPGTVTRRTANEWVDAPRANRALPNRVFKFAIPLAVAASLLLAFYLGTFWPRNNGRHEVRLASVAVRGDVTRGIDDVALDVTNGTDRRVFLTVVGLAPGRKSPAYHYRSEGRYIEVPAGGTAEVKNLPPEFEGSTVLLVVSTHGPAGGVVREVMPPAVTPGSAAADAERLGKTLADLGIDADVRVVALPAKR